MGGLILRHPAWEWSIVSLCRATDPDRFPRFHSAARSFGAKAFIFDLDDSPALAPFSPDLHEIKDRIEGFVSEDYDLIFTHGARGEYTRHERHEQVHQAVCEMIDSGRLVGQPLFFDYEDCGGTCVPRPVKDAPIKVQLTPEEHEQKRRLIRDIYGFQPGSREFEASGSVEAFTTLPVGKSIAELQSLIETSS
jgi:hypothetical protein